MTDTQNRPPRWATINETALHLKVSRDTLRRMVASKEIREHRLGKLIRYDLNEIDDMLRGIPRPAAA